MGARFRSRRQQTKQRRGTILVVAFILVAATALIIVEVKSYGTGFAGKTLGDWLNLLGVFAIPAVVGLGAAWFTTQQGKVSDRENKDNQRQAALQTYIDKVSELLLKEHLGERTAEGKLKSEYEQVRNIARVRTITVLTQLDARRIGYVFAFLREAGLMSATSDDNVVSLRHAHLYAVDWYQASLTKADLRETDLREADLREAFLFQANLSGAILNKANLSGAFLMEANLSRAFLMEANLRETDFTAADFTAASLREANLEGADLREANLFQAILHEANLSYADLHNADLSYADLHNADLSYVDLKKAHLSEANLDGADLTKADLRGANLKGAIGVTAEVLEKQARSLKGAIMPNGTKHP